jgi:serine/tyrosine/threonine adenylyltransferase
MQKNSPFHFDYSYLSLPEMFYSLVKPELFPKPELFLLNKRLCNQLNISTESDSDLMECLLVRASDDDIQSFAQAYAGYQFGHFTMLGDGRAIVIGEHISDDMHRFDVQLKGSGRTPYSRGGDGKATLRAMLREYLISEAMHHLNIPTSRSLAVIKTGQTIYREAVHEGAAVVRVMKSHIRVGTFEFAARFGSFNDIKSLAEYTAKRLYPEILDDDNIGVSLLRKVMEKQIDLVAQWMRVGFIHGVMNTDNTSVSGETFDYGPCAFMNAYHPNTVYSSIDQNGRYAYGNQPRIIKWNIARFAEALMPVLHENQEKSLELAQSTIDSFDAQWVKKYYETMLKKIGILSNDSKYYTLVDELLDIMTKHKMDFTQTFRNLTKVLETDDIDMKYPDFALWIQKWKEVMDQITGRKAALECMGMSNPYIIPRNHIVENALDEAVRGNVSIFEKLMQALSNPYEMPENAYEYMAPSTLDFERKYQTFCGT